MSEYIPFIGLIFCFTLVGTIGFKACQESKHRNISLDKCVIEKQELPNPREVCRAMQREARRNK